MGLYRRGKTYWCQFYVGGERVMQSTGTANRRDAERICAELRRRANAQRHRVPLVIQTLPFAAVAAEFLASTGKRTYHVERLKQLLPFFGARRLSQISRGLVDEYRTLRLATVSAATVNRDVAVLRHILFWAVDEGRLDHNPLARFRQLPEPRRPRRVLSVGDEVALLKVAPPHLRTIVTLALDTGLRRGEILGQQRQHLDGHRRVLLVSASKTAGGTGREIPWTNRVAEILTPLCSGDGPIVTYDDVPLRSIKKAWSTAVTHAGIRYLRFHDTRHTFNTRLMEAGVSQDVRKALMGHADSDINAVYTHVELPAKRRAIGALERWYLAQLSEWEKGGANKEADNMPNQQSQGKGQADES